LRSAAVLRALWDTAAVFYRLRILRTYQRKRGLVGAARPSPEGPLVSVIGDPPNADWLDYPWLEHAADAENASGDVLAVLGSTARPAGNWVAAAVPFFRDPLVAAVVVPTVAPLRATRRECVAAAVLESRLGGGSRRSRHFPGNVRTVSDFPADNVVVWRSDYLAARRAAVDDESLVAWLAARGRRTVYTPDSSVSVVPLPVFRPHLRDTFRHATARGTVARRTRGGSLSLATTISVLPAAAAVLGALLVTVGTGRLRDVGILLVGVYAVLLTLSAVLSAVRFRSLRVGLLAIPALVATQGAYVGGFIRGLVVRR